MTTGSQRPGLSIVVNNYNYADYIAASLDSALAQMDVRDELIVVDDGSTDNSLLTLKPYVDAQLIRLIEQPVSNQAVVMLLGCWIATITCSTATWTGCARSTVPNPTSRSCSARRRSSALLRATRRRCDGPWKKWNFRRA